jgi:hypothetical protein
MPEPKLSHNVFFTLADGSPANIQSLVAACKKYLTVQPGILTFSCGPRETGLNREVNDTGFHVGLHVLFTNRAAHDAYQTDAMHEKFVHENKPTWKRVQVFDTLVETVAVKS